MNKKKINTSTIALIIIVIGLVLFTCVMVWIHHVDGNTPDVLISCVYAACTGELGILGFLKANKRKYENQSQNYETFEFNEGD